MKWVAVRNFLIIAAIAALGVVWREGFSAIAVSANQVITVIFVAVLALFGYSYFRQNREEMRRVIPVILRPTPPRYFALPRRQIWFPSAGFFPHTLHCMPINHPAGSFICIARIHHYSEPPKKGKPGGTRPVDGPLTRIA